MTVAEMTALGWIRRVGAAPAGEPAQADETPAAKAMPAPVETPDRSDREREHLDDLKPFEYAGREKTKPDAERAADYFENTSADPDNYPLPENLPSVEELTKNERLLADIRYPGEMDYSRPAGKGVDDSRGFMEDSREENGGKQPAAGKRGLFDRLFGKNKGKNGK